VHDPAPLPELAPVALMLVLLELAAGTMAVAYLIDAIGRVGRGFAGTTAGLCALVMGVELLIGAAVPGDTRLLDGPVGRDALASVVHWSLGFTGALLVFAFFCAAGTDAARRVVGAITLAVGAVTIGQAAVAFGGALGGAVTAAVAFVPAALVEGGALAGMLLGHWYLVAPSLSFRPLRQMINIVLATLAVESLALALVLGHLAPAVRGRILTGEYALPFWLLVVGAGIVFTGGITLLTRHFARIRANQPATAMLYALIVSVVMGIVPAHLLFFVTGAPL
jgi:hypothetical protein